MFRKPLQKPRTGSVLVEYGLLIAGVVLTCVLGIAVLGQKLADNFGIAAAIMPGAHADDNKPVSDGKTIPFNSDGPTITLDPSKMVNQDRFQAVLGSGGGESLIVDNGP